MKHECQAVEKRVHVRPAKTMGYPSQFMECECGKVWATPAQRKKNDKQYRNSHNRWVRNRAMEMGSVSG